MVRASREGNQDPKSSPRIPETVRHTPFDSPSLQDGMLSPGI